MNLDTKIMSAFAGIALPNHVRTDPGAATDGRASASCIALTAIARARAPSRSARRLSGASAGATNSAGSTIVPARAPASRDDERDADERRREQK